MKTAPWVAAALVIAACVAAAHVTRTMARQEPFAPLDAPSGVMGRRHVCSATAAAAAAAASGSARDRLVAAARTQSALYPSVLPN